MKFKAIRIVKLCESIFICLLSLCTLVYAIYLLSIISSMGMAGIILAIAAIMIGISGAFAFVLALISTLKVIFDKPDNAKFGGYLILFLFNLGISSILPSLLISAIEDGASVFVVLSVILILIFIFSLVTDVMIILDRVKVRREQIRKKREQKKKEIEFL